MSDGNEVIYDFVSRSASSGLLCKDPSKAVQSEAEDADINTIVRRFGLTGTMPQGLVAPTFADFDDVLDYHSAQLAIVDANNRFMSMPADVRAKFSNDAGIFVDFASDPANIDVLREFGLAVPKPIVEVVEDGKG